MYFGYEILQNNGRSIQFANPEKCILDYLYLHSAISNIQDFEGLRLNREMIKSRIDKDLMNKYLNQFDSLELRGRYNLLVKYLNA